VLSPHETGGLLAFKKAAAVAEAAGVSICLHRQSVTGISNCAQHQIGMTIPNLTDGNQIMHQLLTEDIITAPEITPRRGKIGPILGPGLGFELDDDAVNSCPTSGVHYSSTTSQDFEHLRGEFPLPTVKRRTIDLPDPPKRGRLWVGDIARNRGPQRVRPKSVVIVPGATDNPPCAFLEF